MDRRIGISTTAIIVFLMSCSPSRQMTGSADSASPANYTTLERQLIEDYLTKADLVQIQELYEDEVKVYNNVDELEYEGKLQNREARLFILKGDFLLQVDQTAVYRIDR